MIPLVFFCQLLFEFIEWFCKKMGTDTCVSVPFFVILYGMDKQKVY